MKMTKVTFLDRFYSIFNQIRSYFIDNPFNKSYDEILFLDYNSRKL